MRQVQGLKSVRVVTEPEYFAAKHTRVQALGLAYERRVFKAVSEHFPNALHNPWIEFEDEIGVSLCSPDIIIRHPMVVHVLECKLTWTSDALVKLRHLYLPLVEALYNRPVRGIIVAKVLTHEATAVCPTLNQAFADPEDIPTLHWLGRGAINYVTTKAVP